ncbi:glycosyltransferase [Candidatus Saccharibacteria bacterium]|nr:glycosyltransferase [Candidatus Saccharibacteria bacterium]
MSRDNDKRKSICFFTLYTDKGASSKYRIIQFREDLEKKYDTKWFNFWNDKYTEEYINNKKKYIVQIVTIYLISAIKRIYQLLFIAPKYDIVFIQKTIIPKNKNTFLSRIKKRNRRIIYDVDDAVYEEPSSNSDNIAEKSDLIICGNQILRNHYKKINNKCIVIPTIDNTKLYPRYWKNTFDNKIIGWIGSKSTINNLDLIIKPLKQIIENDKRVHLRIICSDTYGYENKIDNIEFVKWDKTNYLKSLSDITIGIMPLYDTSFNRGKCGFKLIQYLSLKKPVIASDVGVNKTIVKDCGLIAHNESEWGMAIKTLLYDEKQYNKMSDNIENSFLSVYGYDVIYDKLTTAIEAIK